MDYTYKETTMTSAAKYPAPLRLEFGFGGSLRAQVCMFQWYTNSIQSAEAVSNGAMRPLAFYACAWCDALQFHIQGGLSSIQPAFSPG